MGYTHMWTLDFDAHVYISPKIKWGVQSPKYRKQAKKI